MGIQAGSVPRIAVAPEMLQYLHQIGLTASMPSLRLLPALLLFCAQTCLATPTDRLGAALRDFLNTRSAALPGRVSVEIGAYPRSEKILACERWQISLPEGSRLWGRVSLNARCLAGSRQALYVAALIRLEGKMLVAARHIPNGWTIGPDDLRSVNGDLTNLSADLLFNETEAIGRSSRSSILAGRPLQRSLLREQNLVRAGQPVRLVFRNAKLSVSNEGVAMGNAALGQNVRVRLPGGKILSGKASAEGVIDVGP